MQTLTKLSTAFTASSANAPTKESGLINPDIYLHQCAWGGCSISDVACAYPGPCSRRLRTSGDVFRTCNRTWRIDGSECAWRSWNSLHVPRQSRLSAVRGYLHRNSRYQHDGGHSGCACASTTARASDSATGSMAPCRGGCVRRPVCDSTATCHLAICQESVEVWSVQDC